VRYKTILSLFFIPFGLTILCAIWHGIGYRDAENDNREKIGETWDDGKRWGEFLGELRGYRRAMEEQQLCDSLDSLSKCEGKEYILVCSVQVSASDTFLINSILNDKGK